MKTLIFILLKIGEICLIPIAYILLCTIAYCVEMIGFGDDLGFFNIFSALFGLLVLAVLFLIILLISVFKDLIIDWIKCNKEWSDTIYNKFKK